MLSFANKVVWLTGASSGIGEALAYALAERGASLVLSARREDALRRVQSACARPEEHMVLPLDVQKTPSLVPAAQSVLERFGCIDILTHSAGLSQRERAIETQLHVDRQIMDVNFFGPVALTKAVLPSMIERRSGQIVVISSLLGKFGAPMRSSYCASKHALHGFFDALRAELYRDGIAVTIVCPGFVRTNASINALTGDGKAYGQMDENIRNGLASDEAARRIVQAIERRRREVYIGGKERFAVYLSRYAPRLFGRIIRSRKLK